MIIQHLTLLRLANGLVRRAQLKNRETCRGGGWGQAACRFFTSRSGPTHTRLASRPPPCAWRPMNLTPGMLLSIWFNAKVA